MGIHYSNGFGKLYDKEAGEDIANVKYQLIETDPTKYTAKKWWGQFSTNIEIKRIGNYVIEFDDGRKSDCVIFTNTEMEEGLAANYYYRFYGRGRLGKHL